MKVISPPRSGGPEFDTAYGRTGSDLLGSVVSGGFPPTALQGVRCFIHQHRLASPRKNDSARRSSTLGVTSSALTLSPMAFTSPWSIASATRANRKRATPGPSSEIPSPADPSAAFSPKPPATKKRFPSSNRSRTAKKPAAIVSSWRPPHRRFTNPSKPLAGE